MRALDLLEVTFIETGVMGKSDILISSMLIDWIELLPNNDEFHNLSSPEVWI